MTERDLASPFSYSAADSTLLILDYHTLFVEASGAHKAAETTKKLKQWAIEQNIPVAHALLDNSKDCNPASTTKGLERTTQILSRLRDDQAQFEEPVGIRAERVSEMVFTRVPGLVSALTSKQPYDIVDWLRQRNCKSLILCGLSTSGCTLRTAISASDMGFVVSVIADACHDRDVEVHRVVLDKILPTRAHVFTREELKTQWEASYQ